MTSSTDAPVRRLAETDSTNRVALEWAADGAEHGAAVVADFQTSGRGRHGRAWASAAGANLLISVVLRPPNLSFNMSLVPFAAALAAAEALELVRPEMSVALKWPNDLVTSGSGIAGAPGKLGGILVESVSRGPERVAVAGIGLNLNQTSFAPLLAETATSVLLETGRRVEREDVLEAVLDCLQAWTEREAAELMAGVRQRLTGVGDEVSFRLRDDGDTLSGRFMGVSDDGGAVLDINGERRTFYAGEITIGGARQLPEGSA